MSLSFFACFNITNRVFVRYLHCRLDSIVAYLKQRWLANISWVVRFCSHRENIFPRSGCLEWIGSTDPVDRMSPRPSQLRSRSIHLE